MITKEEYRAAQQEAARQLAATGVVLTNEEPSGSKSPISASDGSLSRGCSSLPT
jgi:hypothetical protein